MSGNLTTYAQDQDVSVLACLEQLQLCNPSTTQCTSPNSFFGTNFSEYEYILTTDKQKKIAISMGPPLQYSTIGTAIQNTQLLAENLVIPISDSLPLAPDQWILEAENAFQIGLGTMQRMMVNYISGPSSLYLDYVPKNQADNDTDLAWLCSNQIIRRNVYLNFSSLSLGLMIGIGTVVIGVSLWLEMFVGG
jgi:hypothetical protein